MVFIHGGGFVTGSSNSEMYGAEFLLTEDVILVTLNYRLGVLGNETQKQSRKGNTKKDRHVKKFIGFLAFDDPTLDASGNACCKDIVMALRWVQQNIKHFGGDPNNVTAFGHSAGGAAVHLLMLSPMAKGVERGQMFNDSLLNI